MKFIVKIRVDEKEKEATSFHYVTLVLDGHTKAVFKLIDLLKAYFDIEHLK